MAKKPHENIQEQKRQKPAPATKPVPAAGRSGDDALALELMTLLEERGQTVAFAESCSGGILSAMLTVQPGVSKIFAGSVVAYSYPAKERLLHVPPTTLRVHGAVSIPVARKMASGARAALLSTWALSITGIAGPGGGTDQKPVGTVCFGIVGPGIEEGIQRQLDGSRQQIQESSARFALRWLRAYLLAAPLCPSAPEVSGE